MQLPKNYFENLSPGRYREYLKLLPKIKKDSTKTVTMLIITFVALSFLGIFAINPTLSTIVELQKQLSDSQFVDQQLTTKIKNLSSLQQQYDSLSNDLPVIDNSIPNNADIANFIGQIRTLSKNPNLQLTFLKISPVMLTASDTKKVTDASFVFSIEVHGDYDNLINYVTSLTKFNRMVTLESLALIKNPQDNNLILSVSGRGYFKK
ncbi:MAG TPA: type 4a pilus biogenesis protein PilO [Patescibacteria group bacterium]